MAVEFESGALLLGSVSYGVLALVHSHFTNSDDAPLLHDDGCGVSDLLDFNNSTTWCLQVAGRKQA